MRRGAVAVAALVGVLLLSGCDPYPADGAGGVALDATLRGDGSAQILMFLDASPHDDAQMLSWGEGAASRLFPEADAVDVRIDPNGYGSPFDVIEVTGAFTPGPHPEVRLDGPAAVAWLLDQGTPSVSLWLAPPAVASTPSWTPDAVRDELGAWSWPRLSSPAEAPAGTLRLTPQPWQGLLPVLLLVVSVGAVVGAGMALRRRRRALGFPLAGVAFLSPAGLVAVGGPTRLDHLAAAGWLPASAYGPARWAMILPLVAAGAGALVAAVGLALDRPSFVGRPGQVFVAPPGWPTPPPGWRPPLGWQPDPSWPRPPAGWEFFRDGPVA